MEKIEKIVEKVKVALVSRSLLREYSTEIIGISGKFFSSYEKPTCIF